ncbi:MAG TPA: hypothetical protein VFX02_08740 [Gammaproteobacteria bacterium]|nr:hypothetical protein [Gammaproteobacteria bacterium]
MVTRARVIRLLTILATFMLALVARAGDSADSALQEKLGLFQRFEANLAKPLPERVQTIPDDFLKLLIDYDKSSGIKNTDYKAHTLSTEESAIFGEYLQLLPARHQTTFSNKLMVVYFVENFSGAGLTDWLIDKNNNFYYYTILNSALLTESLDDWLTYRENSFFTAGSPFSIKLRTGTDFKALLYGLLHEGGHIVDIEYRVTPYMDPVHRKLLKQESAVSDFTRGVWEGQKKPAPRYGFGNQDKLNAYGIFNREPVPATEMESMLLQLNKTPFVSFYAGTAWYEDFADLIAYKHLQKNLDGFIRLEFYKDGKLVKRFRPVGRKQSAERKRIVREFIGGKF